MGWVRFYSLAEKSTSVICSHRVQEALQSRGLKRLVFEDLYDMDVTPMAKEAYANSLKALLEKGFALSLLNPGYLHSKLPRPVLILHN